jgi:hypothetical protein
LLLFKLVDVLYVETLRLPMLMLNVDTESCERIVVNGIFMMFDVHPFISLSNRCLYIRTNKEAKGTNNGGQCPCVLWP